MSRTKALLFVVIPFLLSSCFYSGVGDEVQPDYTAYPAQSDLRRRGAHEDFGDEEIPPDILAMNERRRAVGSYEEWISEQSHYLQSLDDCLQERGWPEQKVAEANTPMVTINFTGWQGQVNHFVADVNFCFTVVAPAPEAPEISVEEAKKDYLRALKAAECFRKDGFDISQAPSEQVFIEESMKGTRRWFPEDEIPIDKFNSEYYQKCPW